MLLDAAKCQGYSFYLLWVIKGKPTVGSKISPPRLGLNRRNLFLINFYDASMTWSREK